MSDLKYVLIEMIENDVSKMSADSIVAGMFKGVRLYDPPDDDMLIIVEKDKDVTYLFNTSQFNVLSLQKFDGYTKVIHCWRATKEDQNLALDMLADIVKELNEDNRTIDSDDNIIDTTTYTCVPDDVTVIKGSSTPGITVNKPFYKKSSYEENRRKTTVLNTDPEPKCFKRSKKPGKNVLEKMQKKISEIKAGTYQIKLPIVKGDDIKIASENSTDVDEIYDSNFYMHG